MTTPSHVQLHGISKKSDENRRIHLLKKQPNSSTAFMPLGSNKVPEQYIRGGFVPTSRDANTAEAVNHVALTRPGAYRTGDGDVLVSMRPGCDDHKKYDSVLTGGSIVYPRGHK